MDSHPQGSSPAGEDYYTHSLSTSSLPTDGSLLPTPTTRPSFALPGHPRQKTSLANIIVPSFTKFRSQVSSIPVASPTPLRTASVSRALQGSPRVAEPSSRPFSLDSPVRQLPPQRDGPGDVYPLTPGFEPTQEKGQSPNHPFPARSQTRNELTEPPLAGAKFPSSHNGGLRRSSIPIHARYAQDPTLSHAPKLSTSSSAFASSSSPVLRLSTVSSTNGCQEPPSMRLEFDGVRRTLTDESLSPLDESDARRPKSPGRLGGFFGWRSGQRSGTESPTTTFSDRSPSSFSSPNLRKTHSMEASPSGSVLTPPGVDAQGADSSARREYFNNPETPILLGSDGSNAHVKELERELTNISTELADSIRREMELEDEIERVKVESTNGPPSEAQGRSSDYFSDSGLSVNRFPITDLDSKLEQLEQRLRKCEQEKAQVKVEMASRLQSELSRRRDLEDMVKRLEEQLQAKFDDDDERGDMDERVDELESTLEDTRRLLNQERQAKASFEDLYSATRGEAERHKNEHDNLRDENTRMQQEMNALNLRVYGRVSSIAEEGEAAGTATRMSLGRSASLARSGSRRGGSVPRDGTRQRSGSGASALPAENAKAIEDQRDALHKALKLLILRSEKQQKDHERAFKKLSSAKHQLEVSTPGRSGYHKEVAFLKEEVTTLRKRTEDALEQKWQYEKGLSGIKMDLDRAELETRGLRIILQEHDILGRSQRTLLEDGKERRPSAAKELQESISTAEFERDRARKVAEGYRQRAQTVQDGSSTELLNSAKRMDELAGQLDKQVQSNVKLRARLAEIVAKGEREQKESNGKIFEMQKRLSTMEESVLAAQQHSESTLNSHEAEVRRLEESSSPGLKRLTINVADSKRLAPTDSMMLKSPRLSGQRRSDASLLEMSKTLMLERKVRELESLLHEAEEDMQDVVMRVNRSQMEVAELQSERDAVFNQMRKLQDQMDEEREKVEDLMR